jgi:hypothetical protein
VIRDGVIGRGVPHDPDFLTPVERHQSHVTRTRLTIRRHSVIERTRKRIREHHRNSP